MLHNKGEVDDYVLLQAYSCVLCSAVSLNADFFIYLVSPTVHTSYLTLITL